MLQEFLRRGKNGQKKKKKKNHSNFMEGSSAEFGICSRPVWLSAYGRTILQKAAMEVMDFSVGVCGGCFDTMYKGKSTEKIRRRIRQPKTKNRRCDDPEIHQPCPKIRHKNFQQIRLSNLQVHARYFLIEKFCSWGRFQRTDSRTLFGCVLLMVEAPMLKRTCNPLAAAGGRDKVCCAPSRQHF